MPMSDAERARALLQPPHTCVLVRGTETKTSDRTGIAPMMEWIAAGENLRGCSAADKIVGKAAAMLFVKTGIVAVYAEVLSTAGQEYLTRHGIPVTAQTVVDRIINRQGTGPCPMEAAVRETDDAETGYKLLCDTLKRLKGE